MMYFKNYLLLRIGRRLFDPFRVFIIAFFISTNVFATNYYVSNTGSDSQSGLTAQMAWQTIAKVNACDLQPGDAVLFERGGVWREELLIQQSGNSQHYIVYSAYGTGLRPRILGSNRSEGWINVQGNIWRTTNELAAPRTRTGNSTTNHPSSIFFGQKDGSITWGNMEAIHLNSEGAPKDICERDRDNGFELMDREYDWCWGDNYIYVYAPENPGTRYSYVEVPQRSSAIYMASHHAQEYIRIENLELMFALKYGFDGGWPMAYEKHGLEVKNCHIAYMGTKGAASAIGLQVWHSDMLIEGNDIHDCGRRNISYNVYSDTRTSSLVFENVTFNNNKLHNGYHTTGIDINGGYTDEFRNFTISNNMIWDNPDDNPELSPNDFSSMGLYLNSGAATFTNFKVYNNVLSFIKQKHISANALKNSFIVHNTFYGMNVHAGGSGYRQMILVSNEPSNLKIENNIFHGNIDDEYVLSAITFANGSESGTSVNHNLYFQEHSQQRTVTVNSTGESYRMTDWQAYLDDTGWDLNSPAPTNPLFINAPDDLKIQSGSQAVGAGVYYAEIASDIEGRTRNNPPTIGAYELNINNLDSSTLGEDVLLYPNPTDGIIFYKQKDEKFATECKVYDLAGKVIMEIPLHAEDSGVDLTTLTSGIYWVKIRFDSDSYSQLIIKN